MCTASRDIQNDSQNLPSISHSELYIGNIPVSDSFSRQSPTHEPSADYSPLQFGIGLPHLSPRAGLAGWWANTARVSKSQATQVGTELYAQSWTCLSSGLPSSSASTYAPSPSPSMVQFYFSQLPLQGSVPSQGPDTPRFLSYQELEGLANAGLFLSSDSPGGFSSVTGSSDEPLNQFGTSEAPSIPSEQWMPCTTSYPTTCTPTDCLQSSSSPEISTATTPPSSNSPQSTRTTRSSKPTGLTSFGIASSDGTWRCAYPGCSSQVTFRRGCDLRKHFNRHRKHLFCRHEGCPQASHGGFSSKKDRARHEAKHNPGIPCERAGCFRMFSRVDNMKDHVRRIHGRGG
jgi:hypothetical protein